MNPIAILSLAITFIQLNKGQTAEGKKIIKEATDVVKTLGAALKDKKITMAEKKAIVKELREFTKTTIDALDTLIIPEKTNTLR
mgnify:FL=1|tara:strand:+ start:341 stop:592 length:252 start_codon:yes stop_codon:yes gene_type:complete